MKIDVSLTLTRSVDVRPQAREAERAGLAGAWVSEASEDPFLALGLCATATQEIALGSAVAIALARNPMTVATSAHGLQALSAGRLRLGLGTQVQAHVERRFSMPWSAPVDRMREFVAALRAIWRAWETGEDLRFNGDFYTHTLMNAAFTPAPHGHRAPPVLLSGVGPRMTTLAGEIADGFIAHAFSTPRYLSEVTLPALARGRGPRRLGGFELVVVQMVASGADETALAAARDAVREQIAFYGSTPSYAGVLELHGYGELAASLRAMAHAGRWPEMPGMVDDALLEQVAVVGTPETILARVRDRHGDSATRVSLYAPGGFDGPTLARITEGLAAPA